MARARFIRPEFFTDTKLADMPMGASLLFAGIWCHCDLNGVFEWDARLLRSLIFGVREDVTTKDVETWMAMLATAGILLAYCQSDGKRWGVVKNWSKYQSISGSERQWGARRPNPLDPNTASSMTALDPAHCHAQACPLPLSPTLSLPPTPTPTDDSFVVFWDSYGLKKGKPAAERAWKRLSKADRDAAIARIPAYRASLSDPKYQQHPATYLNGRTWEDEFVPRQLTQADCPYPAGSAEFWTWVGVNCPETVT